MKEILVVGGANVDLVGIPDKPLRIRDSNPGRIGVSFGGVGRNIAHNAVLAGAKVELATIFGNDLLGTSCAEDCRRVGIRLTHSRFSPTHASSMYLAVLDAGRDMHLAISDMEILDELDENRLIPVIRSLDEQDFCVLDTNLRQEVIETLSEAGRCRFALDPISTRKALKAKHLLHRFHVLKPNRYEAEVLLDMKIETLQDVREALNRFIGIGVSEAIISLGEDGIAASNGVDVVLLKMVPEKVVNATGAGDCFLGAYLAERLRSDDFVHCLSYALAASVLTIQKEETVVQDLNDEKIRVFLLEHPVERKNLT